MSRSEQLSQCCSYVVSKNMLAHDMTWWKHMNLENDVAKNVELVHVVGAHRSRRNANMHCRTTVQSPKPIAYSLQYEAKSSRHLNWTACNDSVLFSWFRSGQQTPMQSNCTIKRCALSMRKRAMLSASTIFRRPLAWRRCRMAVSFSCVYMGYLCCCYPHIFYHLHSTQHIHNATYCLLSPDLFILAACTFVFATATTPICLNRNE